MQHDSLKSTTFLSANFNLVRSTITRMGDTYEVNSKCTYPTYSWRNSPPCDFEYELPVWYWLGWQHKWLWVFLVDQLIQAASSQTLYLTKQFLSRLLRRTHIERLEYKAHREPRVDRTPSVVEAATALSTTLSLPDPLRTKFCSVPSHRPTESDILRSFTHFFIVWTWMSNKRL